MYCMVRGNSNIKNCAVITKQNTTIQRNAQLSSIILKNHLQNEYLQHMKTLT